MIEYFNGINQYKMNGFSNDRHFKKATLNGKICLILGFKCYKNDVFMFSDDINENHENSVFYCKFGEGKQFGGMYAICYENGYISLYDTNPQRHVAEEKIMRTAIYDISWIPNKAEIVSAAAQSSVDKWAFKEGSNSFINIGKYKGHKKSVVTIDVNPWDPDTFASGSRDGSIRVWDSRCRPTQTAAVIDMAHSNTSSVSATRTRPTVHRPNYTIGSVKYVGDNRMASVGASDGCIKLWDLRKTYHHGKSKREPVPFNCLKYPGSSSCNAFTSLSFSAGKNMLYASCRDDNIYGYHLSHPTIKPVYTFSGADVSSFWIKTCISPCGDYLLCGSNDDAYIWMTDNIYNRPAPILPVAKLKGHTAEVSSIAWSNDGRNTVVTTGDDMKCFIYKVKHIDPQSRPDPDLSGYAESLEHLPLVFLRKPLLHMRRNRLYYVQPRLGPTRENDDSELVSVLSERIRQIAPSVFVDELPSTSNTPHGNSNTQQENSNTQQENYNSQFPLPCTSGVEVEITTPQHREVPLWSRIPKTSKEKANTLASWLLAYSEAPEDSDEETPTRTLQDTLRTPDSRTSRKENTLTPDCTRKKEESTPDSAMRKIEDSASNRNKLAPKKRLSDLLPHNQENLLCESDKTAKAPTTNILTPPHNVKITPCKSHETKGSDDMDGIKPFDGSKLSQLIGPSSRDLFDAKTPIKSGTFGQSPKLKSPLANLPNYVVDGNSPHNRPEKPITKKRKEDWLTTLSASKKKKTANTLSAIAEEVTPKKQS